MHYATVLFSNFWLPILSINNSKSLHWKSKNWVLLDATTSVWLDAATSACTWTPRQVRTLTEVYYSWTMSTSEWHLKRGSCNDLYFYSIEEPSQRRSTVGGGRFYARTDYRFNKWGRITWGHLLCTKCGGEYTLVQNNYLLKGNLRITDYVSTYSL